MRVLLSPASAGYWPVPPPTPLKNSVFIIFLLLIAAPSFAQTTKAIGKITYEVTAGGQVRYIEMLFSADKYVYFENNSLSNVFEVRSSYPSMEDSLTDLKKKEELSKSLTTQPPSVQMWYGSIEENKVYESFQLEDRRLVTLDTLKFVSWVLQKDTMRINDVLCQKAAGTTPSGSKLTAWFAPSIPVSVAPYTLRGLPGLLLDATSDDGKTSTHVLRLEYPLQHQPIIHFPANEKIITKEASRRAIQEHQEKALRLLEYYKKQSQ